MTRWPLVVLLIASSLVAASCRTPPERLPSPPAPLGAPERGQDAIRDHGCGACHSIPGIADARGRVGPPLDGMARRAFVAGRLPNNAENLAAFIIDPRQVDPENAMPAVGVTPEEAQDIAAYLLGLR